MPALARGSTLVEGAPEKAATLLLDFPAAPYTAFLVDETGCARCFQQHCLRLANGLHELNLWSRYNGETGTVCCNVSIGLTY